jgi:hypothetical protein
MESSGAWGNTPRPGGRARYPAANPFADEENDNNPFTAPSHPPEQVVETILQQHASGTFGTPPPSMASSPQGLQEVPLHAQQQAAGQANSSGSKSQARRLLSFQPQTPPDPSNALSLTSSSLRNARKDSGASSDKTLSSFNISSQPLPNPKPPKQSSQSQPSLKGLGPALPLSSYPSTGQAEIDRRTEELRRWETDLVRREALLRQQAGPSKNWPRFLPILHHDIAADIPFERKGLVRSGYIAWCIVAAGYLWNFVSLTAFFIAGQKKVSLWVMAGLVAVAGLPLSFLCWYRGLYFAASRDSAGRWLFYMLNMLVHIVWCSWMFVGINPDIGGYSAGLFTMISQFNDGGGNVSNFCGRNNITRLYHLKSPEIKINDEILQHLNEFVVQDVGSLLGLCA